MNPFIWLVEHSEQQGFETVSEYLWKLGLYNDFHVYSMIVLTLVLFIIVTRRIRKYDCE